MLFIFILFTKEIKSSMSFKFLILILTYTICHKYKSNNIKKYSDFLLKISIKKNNKKKNM